jgi:hypothetical protein
MTFGGQLDYAVPSPEVNTGGWGGVGVGVSQPTGLGIARPTHPWRSMSQISHTSLSRLFLRHSTSNWPEYFQAVKTLLQQQQQHLRHWTTCNQEGA